MEPDETALCICVIAVDEPTNLPVHARLWAMCLTRSGLGWFYVPALDVQTSPPAW